MLDPRKSKYKGILNYARYACREKRTIDGLLTGLAWGAYDAGKPGRVKEKINRSHSST